MSVAEALSVHVRVAVLLVLAMAVLLGASVEGETSAASGYHIKVPSAWPAGWTASNMRVSTRYEVRTPHFFEQVHDLLLSSKELFGMSLKFPLLGDDYDPHAREEELDDLDDAQIEALRAQGAEPMYSVPLNAGKFYDVYTRLRVVDTYVDDDASTLRESGVSLFHRRVFRRVTKEGEDGEVESDRWMPVPKVNRAILAYGVRRAGPMWFRHFASSVCATLADCLDDAEKEGAEKADNGGLPDAFELLQRKLPKLELRALAPRVEVLTYRMPVDFMGLHTSYKLKIMSLALDEVHVRPPKPEVLTEREIAPVDVAADKLEIAELPPVYELELDLARKDGENGWEFSQVSQEFIRMFRGALDFNNIERDGREVPDMDEEIMDGTWSSGGMLHDDVNIVIQ